VWKSANQSNAPDSTGAGPPRKEKSHPPGASSEAGVRRLPRKACYRVRRIGCVRVESGGCNGALLS
jgi:hypothetical protein